MSANTATLVAPPRTRSRNAVMPTLVGVFARILLRIREYRMRQADLAILRSMDDRTLKDIGLSRCDIERVVRM
jgi:uncharacterized protein YjiS (DUF1127 family)